MNKRTFLRTGLIGTLGLLSVPALSKRKINTARKVFVQPNLPYSYASLSPFIDKETFSDLYSNHHAKYTQQLNLAYRNADIQERALRRILENTNKYPADVIENGAEYMNYKIFWKSLSPNGGGAPYGAVSPLINREFGSFNTLKNEFNSAALGLKNSGWVWLAISDNTIKVCSTSNFQNPNMNSLPSQKNGFPLLGLNMSEKTHRNQKEKYLANFWNVVNWESSNVRLGRYNRI